MSHIWRVAFGNIDVGAVLKQVVRIFNLFATGRGMLFDVDVVMAANCAPGRSLVSTIALLVARCDAE